jgi:FecR protein
MRSAFPRLHRHTLRKGIAAIALMTTTGAWAQVESGRFVFVSGAVSIQKVDGTRAQAQTGTRVFVGDTILTGADGSAQLSMVNEAKLSVRNNTSLRVESYPSRADGNENAVLVLARGTLRTFTGLLAGIGREKFVMKTRTATVGVRGSGNILVACEGIDCDEDIRDGMNPVTVNHTIEGSHNVANNNGQSIITGPGQTVRSTNTQIATIPTPNVIRSQATQFSAKQGTGGNPNDVDTRGFSPADTSGTGIPEQFFTLVGNNGVINNNVVTNDVVTVGRDPLAIRDVIVAGGVVNFGQALAADMTLEAGGTLRAYRAYAGLQSGLAPTISGGTTAGLQTVVVDGTTVVLGRVDNATLSLVGAGSGGLPGSVHFIYGASGYPTFFSELRTGTVSYTLANATAPTNQLGTLGTVTNARLDVDFTRRLLNGSWVVVIPSAANNAGGRWTLAAVNVPITLNTFAATTNDRLTITNAAGTTSTANNRIAGSIAGSFIGIGLGGVLVGYGFSDGTNPAAFNRVAGVALFQGPAADPNVAYVVGLASSPVPGGATVGVVTRSDDVVVQDNQVSRFVATLDAAAGATPIARGTANLLDAGFDPQTGLSWGRWAGGSVTVGGQNVALGNQSVHTIFGSSQRGVTTLPLTGSAEYVAVGNTSPTDSTGNVGRLNSATLNANFTNRTVSAGVNFTIASQTWNASANNMPIYRDQYFSAFAGLPAIAGVPLPSALNITCTPNCGQNAIGTLDGFFTGRNAQGAGVMYNINNITGTVAFRRPGA